jgi:hypothetical protein
MKWIAAVALAVMACSRRHEEPTLTSATLDAAAPVPRQSEMLEATRSWSRAMSQRDLELLAKAYGSRVIFYGVPMRREQVLQALSDAFAKDPSFTQSIENPRVILPARVQMTRRWVAFGVARTEEMWVELAREDGTLAVVLQGDQPDHRDRCALLAYHLVLSSPRANELVHPPDSPRPNEARVAVMPPEWPTYVVAVVDHTTPRPVAIGWFEVTPKTADVTDAFTGETIEPSPKLVAQMRGCQP